MRLHQLDLDRVHVVLFDARLNVRRIIKYALQELGFRRIHDCGDLGTARGFVGTHSPDLLIVDFDADREAACSAVRGIRYQRLGSDPFLVTLATTWNPETDIVRAALDSGVDDIVLKPISVQVLELRIRNMIENRRKFVATSDYLGPQRRRDPERANAREEPPHVTVPNNLRYKATGDHAAAVSDRAVEAAMQAIALQKIQRLSIEITDVALELEELAEEDPGDARARQRIAKVERLVRQVSDYVLTQRTSGMGDIARSMRSFARMLLSAASPTRRQFEILRLHSQAITAALLDRRTEAATLARALENVVAVTRTRAGSPQSSSALPR